MESDFNIITNTLVHSYPDIPSVTNFLLNPYGSKSQTTGSIKYTNNVNRIIETIFIQNPAFTISGILRYPEPKTTALGGVATGNINAQEAATVVATRSI